MVNSEKGIKPCPECIAVIGGGRWARVLVEVLCDVVPTSVKMSVHSRHNADTMSTWASKRGFGQRIQVSSEWPQQLSSRSSAVIVVNAARDHEEAVEWALSEGIPVLVEKPVALTAAASQRLANFARSRNVYFAAAHIFLFASYLENFSKLVAEAENIRYLRVSWKDPQFESRYGERKQYDPGLPVFADCLPHVLSIVGMLMPDLPQMCEKLKFRRGGADLELDLMLGDVPCNVQLVRNGDQRQRIIEVATEKEMLQLDFSSEPGSIVSGSTTMNGDPDWEGKSRPSVRMLTAFLQGAAGIERDSRLNIEIGLRACQVIDQTSAMYRSALMPWLIERLASPQQVDEDLRYAFSEILQSKSPVPPIEINQQINHVRQKFSKKAADARWLKEFAESKDPSTILRSITCDATMQC